MTTKTAQALSGIHVTLKKNFATFLGAKIGNRAVTLLPDVVNCFDLIRLTSEVDMQALQVPVPSSQFDYLRALHTKDARVVIVSSGPDGLAHVEFSPGALVL